MAHPRLKRATVTLTAAVTLAVGGALGTVPATAAPGTAAEAQELVEQAAQKLTRIGEQLHQAEILVEEQRAQARNAGRAADRAAAALAAYEPQLRAIAQSGYTSNQSRVAAFLTSESADDLVQQLTTLDMIATRTGVVVARVAAAQSRAQTAQAAAEAASAKAAAGLAELERQQKAVQRRRDEYEAAFARLSAREQAAVNRRIAGPSLSRPDVGQLGLAPGSAASTVIKTALAQVGDPYVWGATGPDGFDCSGLTTFAYASAGVSLPRSSTAQSQVGAPVSRADLRPGDLVFFYSPISHVGIYIGQGKMVHARTFGQPVNVTSVDMAGYATARRILS